MRDWVGVIVTVALALVIGVGVFLFAIEPYRSPAPAWEVVPSPNAAVAVVRTETPHGWIVIVQRSNAAFPCYVQGKDWR